jgi:hypothetical protein
MRPKVWGWFGMLQNAQSLNKIERLGPTPQKSTQNLEGYEFSDFTSN